MDREQNEKIEEIGESEEGWFFSNLSRFTLITVSCILIFIGILLILLFKNV